MAKLVQEKLQTFRWMIVPHPSYSPDLAPSDFHLFRSMQHFLEGKKFSDEAEVKTALTSFFDAMPPSFYHSGIFNLIKRWRYVVDNDGDYCPDKFEV